MEHKIIPFKFLSHTGDIKFQAQGATKSILFENCALAILSAYAKNQKIKFIIKKRITLKGKDDASLLYNFLEELIFQVDANDFIAAKAKVSIKAGKKDSTSTLTATLFGDAVGNYELDAIKSPTYHDMFVKHTHLGWQAQVILDV